ncbi:MAG: Homoserine O-acetyltransferase [Pseudomonadota bacterium]|jgi:homoserine O-acetyltransferase/O-succinyltransferase
MAILDIGSLKLHSGGVLPSVEVAYTTRGRLAPDGRNAILVTHGFTSAHTMIEPGHHVAEGSWLPILGPGLPLDTQRWFIVCSNMLGSAAGTTGPRSINPATGRPWGPDFPDIRLEDIVAVQHRLLQALGVRHLRAVLGPSYGGWQALQWALSFPDEVDAIGVIASDFRHPIGQSKATQIARLSQSPQWHGGWYYDTGGMAETLLALRLQTLQNYGLETLYEQRYPDPAQRRAAMEAPARAWSQQFDANSMVVLAAAAEHFDVASRVEAIRARTLLVQCNTDKVFPASEESRALLARVSAPTRYVELDSPYGHMASGVEIARWQDQIAWLLEDQTPKH